MSWFISKPTSAVFSDTGQGSGFGLVVAWGVEGQLAQEFAGGGVDDAE